jgi:uncharacterized protein
MLSENIPASTNEAESKIIVPWSVREVIFGTIAAIILTLGAIFIVIQRPESSNLMMVAVELAYLLPVIVVLLIKKAKPERVGLRKFKLENLALGCGLIFGAYILIFVHNVILLAFGIAPQGELLTELFGQENLGILIFTGVVLAPLVEETFFRGFVYSGLQQKYSWKVAALISSLLFAIAHMQLVALIPTFLMGFVLAYLYQRSKSIWPGIILHLVVNSFAFSMIYLMTWLEKSL